MPVSPELLRRLSRACEENAARQTLKSYDIGRRYPSGVVPPWGVTLCRDWLQEGLHEDSFEFRLLNLIEIDSDDHGWSINGEPQGGVWDLVKWIVGEMSPEDAGWVRTDMHVHYDELVSEAEFAAERAASQAQLVK